MSAQSTDVLVIGAGLLGCATAYQLARLGCETLVVDAGEIGAGASGATAGNLHLQLSPASHKTSDPGWMAELAAQLPFFLQSVALWRELAGTLPRDIELRVPGGLMVAETAAQMQALAEKVAVERANGLEVELLGAAELRARAPYLADGLLGAAWCPGEGWTNALASVLAFAEGARRAGARLLTRTAVVGLAPMAAGWEVRTVSGTIVCRRLVLATGHASDRMGDMAGIAIPVTSRPIHVSVTEPARRHVEHLVYHTDLRMTLKQVANGNIMLGGGWAATTDARLGRPAVLRDSLARSVWVGQHVVPALARLQIIRSWAGRNVYTPDGRPILGPVPGHPGLHLAVCNTYGFTQGPLCGLLVAESVVGRSPSADLRPFLVERLAQTC